MTEEKLQRSREHINDEMSQAKAFHVTGMCYLLRKKPYLSLAAYAKAISISLDDRMIDKSLKCVKRLEIIQGELPGYEWIELLLLLACARIGKERSHKALLRIKKLTQSQKRISGPIIIIAGASAASIQKQLGEYRQLLIESFRNYTGTIISGGTTSGISGLVGDIQEQYEGDITTIGYVPRSIPAEATIDTRYSEIQKTAGSDFSPSEVVSYWSDIIASRIDPKHVKLIGIAGGQISAIEYRIALALGAKVGILEKSGYEAAKLLTDRDWNTSANLLRLQSDIFSIKAFVEKQIDK